MTSLPSFDRDTAVSACGAGRFDTSLSKDWWAIVGPNGGYLAAIVLRAMMASVAAERTPRSMHLRYLSGGKEGPAQVQIETLREGRSLSVLSARLIQEEKTLVVASGALGVRASNVSYCDATPPALKPRDQCTQQPSLTAINERFDSYRALGGEPRVGERALSGGYIRLREPRVPDVLLMATLWDAWAPTPLFRCIEERFGGAAPTVEASVYFRSPLSAADADPTSFLQLRLESQSCVDGYFEESGELWSPSGALLVQSRQLAMLY